MTSLSRSGTTNPSGKLTRRVDVPISEELEEALIGLSFGLGISKAEYSRRILEEAVFGRLSMHRRVAQAAALCPSDEYPHTGGGGAE